MHWYLDVLKKYAVFSGRAQREEFWMFALFTVIISIVLTVVEGMVSGTNILANLYSLAVLLPSIAVAVRRLHDTSRSGWWVLIGLIPLIGLIVLLIFYIQDSTPGSNEHGPNPKGA